MTTVQQMIGRVILPQEHCDLACQFLLVFSRFEAALKLSGYARQDRRQLVIEWKRFVQENGDRAAEPERIAPYLVRHPPARQHMADGELKFADETTPETVTSEWILEMVYRVRNNLFHGGKWPAEPARDGALLRSCLDALSYYVDLRREVSAAYFRD